MLALRIIFKPYAMRAAIIVASVLLTRISMAQSPFDAAARIALADQINRTYGELVSPSQSITELFDIKNRLDAADRISQQYGIDLDYRQHTFIELCDIESRIRLSVTINQEYGKNVDWREYGYSQLLDMDQQLKSRKLAQKD
jgi:hypothetical protein